MTTTLEQRFDEKMEDVYRRANSEAHYNASRYLQMLQKHRGLETARVLLHAPTQSEGFTALWERGRLDLTVEALILDHPEFHPLFTSEELEMARQRLAKYEYAPAVDPVQRFIGKIPSEAPKMIELTEEQRQAVKNGEAVRVAAPEIGEDLILLTATQYQKMRELLEDKREQATVLRYSMKQAGKVAKENAY